MSKWRHGCDKDMTVYVPKGYDYIARTVKCGSTSFTGGVNQCNDCHKIKEMPEPREDESDMDYYERTEE